MSCPFFKVDIFFRHTLTSGFFSFQPSDKKSTEDAEETNVDVHKDSSPESIDRPRRQVLTESQVLEMLDAAEVRSNLTLTCTIFCLSTSWVPFSLKEEEEEQESTSLPFSAQDGENTERSASSSCNTRLWCVSDVTIRAISNRLKSALSVQLLNLDKT